MIRLQAAQSGRVRRAVFGVLYTLGVLLLPVSYLMAVLPGLGLLNYLGRTWGAYWYILAAPTVAISFIILLCLEIAAAKWILLGRVRPGRYSLESWFHLRKWFVDRLMDISLDLLGPLYATLYLAPWYRLLGAKVGKNAEISTACATSPDLLTLGDGSFIADCVSLGVSRVEAGSISIAPTSIGKQAFVGNSALVTGGTVIGDDSLIGVLSMPPLAQPGAEQPSTSWLGSPAIFLPQRQVSTAFAAESTYRPTRRLYCLRALIEFFRIILPITCFVILTCLLIGALTWLRFEILADLGGFVVSAAVCCLRHRRSVVRGAGEVDTHGPLRARGKTPLEHFRVADRATHVAARESGQSVSAGACRRHAVAVLVLPAAGGEDRPSGVSRNHAAHRIRSDYDRRRRHAQPRLHGANASL